MNKKLRVSTKLYKGFTIPETAIIFKSSKNYDLIIKGIDLEGITLWNIDLDETKKISHNLFDKLFPSYGKLVEEKNNQVLNKENDESKIMKDKKTAISKKIINSYLNVENNKLNFN